MHTFFLSDPRKAASLMPCGEHNTYWAVAITGEDIKVCAHAFVSVVVLQEMLSTDVQQPSEQRKGVLLRAK